jgi:hypothetical protein
MSFRPAVADDRDIVVDILIDAFGVDPIMSWALGLDDYHRRLRVMFDHLIGDGVLPFGHCTVNDERTLAIVMLGPGDRIPDDFWAERTDRLVDELGGDVERLAALNEVSESRVPDVPHWNLFAIGARPDRQTQGLAHQVMAGVLVDVDRRAEPMYAEATNTRSRDIALRYGFTVVDEYRVLDSPPLWTVWREPGAPGRPA